MKEKPHGLTGLWVPEIAKSCHYFKRTKTGSSLKKANNDLNYAYMDTLSGKH